MPCLPSRFAAVILTFAPLFLQRSWRHAEVLLTGAILAPGRRTVASILRITGLARERRFVNYHRVLNRAASVEPKAGSTWCPRAASRLLLGLLVAAFAPAGPVVLGIDDTIERRRGKRIAAKGIYRDPVRSSHGHFVKASGLRWLSLMLLVPIPWAERIWALPFLTALAPSERHCRERGRQHKKLTDWGRQLVLQARRWLPGRELVVVADSAFAALEFLAAVSRRGVACVTRLRLDAALYDPAPPRLPGTNGRPRTKGKRLANLSEVLTDPATTWQRATVPGWYGGGERDIEISTSTAVWRHGGMPVVPIRWASAHAADASATLWASSTPRPCSAPTRPRTPLKSCAGSSSAGRSVEPGLGSTGGHVPGSARPPRRGNATAVVRQGHRAHHALPARLVLTRHLARQEAHASCAPGHGHQRLVSQATSDLLRHARRRAPRHLARTGFRHVPQHVQHAETPPSAPGRHNLRTLPCRLMAKVELSRV